MKGPATFIVGQVWEGVWPQTGIRSRKRIVSIPCSKTGEPMIEWEYVGIIGEYTARSPWRIQRRSSFKHWAERLIAP